MAIVAKRTTMTLYSDANDIYSHQVRIVLAEKGVNVDIHHVEPDNVPEDLYDINPYASVPTLIDRDLVIFEARIIMEYLDERFPHPPLLPVTPVAKAESRKMMFRIEKDWYSLVREIEAGGKNVDETRQHLLDSLIGITPVFADKPYFLNTEFSMLDCCLAPMFWRLTQLGIEIPPQAHAIKDYMARLFERDSFQTSLTDIERELQAA